MAGAITAVMAAAVISAAMVNASAVTSAMPMAATLPNGGLSAIHPPGLSYCSSANHGAFGSYLPDEDYYTDEELPAVGLPPPASTQSDAAFATSKVEWRDEEASAAPSPPP